MTIGEQIRKYRKAAKLTQRELAERAGTATGTIQQYELGKRQPRLEQLTEIARALNLSVQSLLEPEGEAPIVLREVTLESASRDLLEAIYGPRTVKDVKDEKGELLGNYDVFGGGNDSMAVSEDMLLIIIRTLWGTVTGLMSGIHQSPEKIEEEMRERFADWSDDDWTNGK